MIRTAREGGLWTVTLDRPDRANALTLAMPTELAETFEVAREGRDLASRSLAATPDIAFGVTDTCV